MTVALLRLALMARQPEARNPNDESMLESPKPGRHSPPFGHDSVFGLWASSFLV
jgi:hypothetical protein